MTLPPPACLLMLAAGRSVARVERGQSRSPEVATALDDARATFMRMGARPLLALLERTAAREVSTEAKPARCRTATDAPIAST